MSPDPIPRNRSLRNQPTGRVVPQNETRVTPQDDARRVTPQNAPLRPAPAVVASPSDRRGLDLGVIVTFLFLAATVVAPWLIGKLTMRDSWLYKRNAEIFDDSIRTAGTYFLSDYLSGLVIIGGLAAAVLLLGNWRGRAGVITFALVLGFGVVVAGRAGQARWAVVEARSVTILKNGAYPYADRVGSTACGSDVVTVGGVSYLVGLQSHESGGVFGPESCPVVNVYRGWRYLGKFDLPAGASVGRSYVYPSSKLTLASYALVVDAGRTYLYGFSLAKFNKPWRRSVPELFAGFSIGQQIMQLGPLLVVPSDYGEDEIQGRRTQLTGIDRATGKVAWTVRCPRGSLTAGYPGQAEVTADTPGLTNPILMSCINLSTGTVRDYSVSQRGKLILAH